MIHKLINALKANPKRVLAVGLVATMLVFAGCSGNGSGDNGTEAAGTSGGEDTEAMEETTMMMEGEDTTMMMDGEETTMMMEGEDTTMMMDEEDTSMEETEMMMGTDMEDTSMEETEMMGTEETEMMMETGMEDTSMMMNGTSMTTMEA